MSEESVSDSLIRSVISVLFRLALAFEPLAPTAITVALNQLLHRYKEGDIIGDYKTHAKRLGKYHYLIQIDLDVNDMQATHLLANIFPSQFSRFRRWFHD